MALTLLVGGARSGKSSLAVEMGERFGGPVTFLATAPVGNAGDPALRDDDMARRIARHRLERPSEWTTIEEETELVDTLRTTPDGMVIIDCLTLWTSNLMFRDVDPDEIRSRAVSLAVVCAGRTDPVVAISNEVGLGVHPETELGRRYRDLLGHVNQMFASVADQSLFLVAGRALPLIDPWRLLDP